MPGERSRTPGRAARWTTTSAAPSEPADVGRAVGEVGDDVWDAGHGGRSAVDARDLDAARGEMADQRGADEPARTGHDDHRRHATGPRLRGVKRAWIGHRWLRSGAVSAPRYDAVVLGGGPAGLAAAWYAGARRPSRRPRRAGDRVGGLAGSFDVAGVRVDHGSHRLARAHRSRAARRPPRPARRRAAAPAPRRPHPARRALAGVPAARRRPRHDGAAGVRGRAPPRDLAAGAGADAPAGRRHVRRACRGRSRADGRRARSTSRTPASCSASPADELSGELFRRRVGARSGGGVLRRVLARGPRPGFWYPAGGFGRIPEAIADAAVAAGAECCTGVAARGRPAGRRTARSSSWPTDRGCAARRVLSTLPAARHDRRSTAPLVDVADAVAAAAALTYRRRLLVYLVVRAGRTRVRRPLLPRARRPAGPPVRAGELPRRPPPTRPTAPCCAPSCRARPTTSGGRSTPPALGRLVAAALVAEGLPDPDADRRRGAPRRPRLPRVPPRPRRPPAQRSSVGRRRATSSCCSAASRCSPTTTPTTPWPWAAPRRRASGRPARSTGDRWRALRDGFRDHVVED